MMDTAPLPSIGTASSAAEANACNAAATGPVVSANASHPRKRRRMGGESPPLCRAGMSVVAFAESPDRLLCDPYNALWLYAMFEYKYGVTPEDTQAQLLRLLRKIERITAYHFEASVKQFQSMPLNIQQFQVLRATPIGMATTILTPATHVIRAPTHPQSSSGNNPFSTSLVSTPRRKGGPSRDPTPTAPNPTAPAHRPSRAHAAASPSPAAAAASARSGGLHNHNPVMLDEDDDVSEEELLNQITSGEAPLRHPQPLRLPEDHAVRVLACQWPPLVGRSEMEEQLLTLRKHAADQQQHQSPLAGGSRIGVGVPPPVGNTHHAAAGGRGSADALGGAMESHTLTSEFSEAPARFGGASMGGDTGRRSSVLGGARHATASGFPAARPKIKLVLDIVASRKTLGVNPMESSPYKLGQWVYQYYASNAPGVVGGKRSSATVTMAALTLAAAGNGFSRPNSSPHSGRSPSEGRSSVAGGSSTHLPPTSYSTSPACAQVFVGISDSGVKMVGRDFLFPFKVPPGGIAPSGSPGSPQRLSLLLSPTQLLLSSLGATSGPSALPMLPSILSTRNLSSSQPAAMGGGADAARAAAASAARCTRSSSSGSAFSRNSLGSAEGNRSARLGSNQNQNPKDSGSTTYLFVPSGELPVCVRQPPLHLENIDQKRFIVCHPKADS